MTIRPPQPPQSSRPLDAEERALAKSLPRLHGRTAPGPDLDASILAAAQAAVRPAKPTRLKTRPRARWIAPASLAASLVLAVGIAWQLRPLPTLVSAQPTAQSDSADMAAVQVIEPAPYDDPMPMVQSKPAPVPAQSAAAARQARDSPVITSQPHASEREAQALESPAALPAPPPPAPQAPPAAAVAAEAPLGAGASGKSSTASSGTTLEAQTVDTQIVEAEIFERYQQAAPKAAAPAPVMPEVRREARKAADAGFVDDPEQDVPPATVDSPVVRDAWLQRIGELLDQDMREEAKASLTEFRRRYPAAVLPAKLRALEIEP